VLILDKATNIREAIPAQADEKEEESLRNVGI